MSNDKSNGNSNGNSQEYLTKTLVENWRREMQAAALYRMSAGAERDVYRRGILMKLAEVEQKHANMWEQKLKEQGFDTSKLTRPEVSLPDLRPETVVERIEAIETSNATWYQSLRHVISDEEIVRILDEIDADERDHESVADQLSTPHSPGKRLRKIWNEERWHNRGSGDWVGDAIYGVNDGLGAIFGIIAGVAGFTSNTNQVLISGLFGALASTLSMGAGAWLATKSEHEVMDTAIAQERREIDEDPEHEIEELSLLYQLKGFSIEESNQIANRIASNPDQFLKTMVQEELGIHEESKGNPWKSAAFGGASTFVGGIIPLIPFFFMSGLSAMITAAIISLVAHFLVGAAKSLITVRSWWTSGFEMTLVGVIVGVVSYGLGLVGSNLLH